MRTLGEFEIFREKKYSADEFYNEMFFYDVINVHFMVA